MKLESEMKLNEIENAKDPTATITETIEFSLFENKVCSEMWCKLYFLKNIMMCKY